MHVEGIVTVHIRVLPNGAVEVSASPTASAMAWTSPRNAPLMATKFEPATDASGHPIDWEGVVNVAFQLAG